MRDAANQQGYFTGNPNPSGELVHSYGAALPHLGTTRNSRGGGVYYSRLNDGDETSYWKSNPYLTKTFTGDDDSMNPQWVLADLGSVQPVNAIRIAWANPYATHYAWRLRPRRPTLITNITVDRTLLWLDDCTILTVNPGEGFVTG